MIQSKELSAEIERLMSAFDKADENKLKTLLGMIEQAAYERLYLNKLNEQAFISGLVQIHPENATIQRALPVSIEISRHAASLTNILDKLCKHLNVTIVDDDESLDEFI